MNYVVEYSSGCVHCLYLREFMMSSAVWLTTIICWCVECWYIDTVYSMEQLNVCSSVLYGSVFFPPLEPVHYMGWRWKKPRYYSCEVCGKVFQQQCSLSAHKSLHKGSTRCPTCNTVLSRKSNLWRHLKMIHKC